MNKKIVLIICLLGVLSTGFANKTISNDGLSILASHENVTDKSASIAASIEGHFLTIVFLENLGHVEVEITTAAGVHVDADQTDTPSGRQYYISATGDYVVTFTLPNGDEYYGEFTVTD